MRALAVALALVAGPAAAEWACGDLGTQVEMTLCAAQEHQGADARMGRTYEAAIARAREGSAGQEEALRAAQRAWIVFRDLACEAETMPYEGGSIQPMLAAICLTRITKARTEDLEAYVAGLAG